MNFSYIALELPYTAQLLKIEQCKKERERGNLRVMYTSMTANFNKNNKKRRLLLFIFPDSKLENFFVNGVYK